MRSARRFFAEAAKAPAAKSQSMFDQFQSKLGRQVQKLEEVIISPKEPEPSSAGKKAYKHPLDSHEKPVNISMTRIQEYFYDAMGPEQVSPHYESFSVSRRVALIGLFGYSFLAYFGRINDITWIIRTMSGAWTFYFFIFYFFWEARKSLIKPFQNEWYRQLMALEILTLQSNASEDMVNASRESVNLAMEQLEYMNLHKEFQWIKENSVAIFIQNERSKLQQHLKERGTALLRNAVAFEAQNRKNLIQKIIQNALSYIETVNQAPSQQILDSTFSDGLKAIQNDKMTYENDALLGDLILRIRAEIKKFNELSKEEQEKLVALTENQLKQLQSMDESMKNEFVKKTPVGIDNALRTIPHVQEIYNKW